MSHHARLIALTLMSSVALALVSERWAVAQVVRVEAVQQIARLTGTGGEAARPEDADDAATEGGRVPRDALTSINDTASVCIGGTDLGIMVEHRGRVWMLFGDTFRGATPGEGGLWRHNTFAWTRDESPDDGLRFGGWVMGDDGCARQVIEDRPEGMRQVTLIPTGAASAHGWLYVWCMSVRHWGERGEWELNHARLYKSRDGEAFERVEGVEWPGDSRFGMVTAAPGAWADEIEKLDGYEYFAGIDEEDEARWSEDEGECAEVVPATVGEMSLFWLPDAERWAVLLFNHAEARIELRQAEEPWGPWSAPMTVATGADYPMLYGSYTCPKYIRDGGRSVYFTMSMWEPYDVFWMRMDLELDVDAGGE